VAAAAIVRSLCWLLALAIGSRDGAWWKLIIVVTVLVLVLGAAGVGGMNNATRRVLPVASRRAYAGRRPLVGTR
jgi:hypothetical protein